MCNIGFVNWNKKTENHQNIQSHISEDASNRKVINFSVKKAVPLYQMKVIGGKSVRANRTAIISGNKK